MLPSTTFHGKLDAPASLHFSILVLWKLQLLLIVGTVLEGNNDNNNK